MLNGPSDEKLTPETTVDFDDPAHRTGATLFLVLKAQLARLGYNPGRVPFDEKFGSDRCRGALMGTAIAVVRGHYGEPERQHYIDAIVAAFTVVFGEAIGRQKALETIEDSADRNEAVNTSSDLAGKDTIDHWSEDSPSPPMAYYLAATESA